MKEDTRTLDEVVVVGYGVQKKSDLTGAISSVKAEDIQNRSITRVEEALQGKTAGVQLISTTSQPGASPTIRVRGFSSNGTSDPLYVVDGLIVSDLSAVDPNNIKSMEVLKDAASAAIYGAQAGNGVTIAHHFPAASAVGRCSHPVSIGQVGGGRAPVRSEGISQIIFKSPDNVRDLACHIGGLAVHLRNIVPVFRAVFQYLLSLRTTITTPLFQ